MRYVRGLSPRYKVIANTLLAARGAKILSLPSADVGVEASAHAGLPSIYFYIE